MFFTKGYAQQAEVLTLGVFHFEFPNLDVQQVSEEDQIDVLSPQYQREIELISKKYKVKEGDMNDRVCKINCIIHHRLFDTPLVV